MSTTFNQTASVNQITQNSLHTIIQLLVNSLHTPDYVPSYLSYSTDYIHQIAHHLFRTVHGVSGQPPGYTHPDMHACKPTDVLRDRWAYSPSDSPSDRPVYRHTTTHAAMQTYKRTCAQIQTYRPADRHTYNQTDIQSCRHTDRHADRLMGSQTDIQTDSQTSRHT